MLSTLSDNLWPEQKNLSVLGIGYTLPYLPFKSDPTQWSCIALPFAPEPLQPPMAHSNNRICFTEPNALPFPENSFDHILLAHTPVHRYELIDLFKEARRVLKENGTITLIIANSFNQLTCPPAFNPEPAFGPLEIENILSGLLLRTEQRRYCNFIPIRCSPSPLYQIVDMAGSHLIPFLASVLLLQCRKEIYAGRPTLRIQTRRRQKLVQNLAPHYRSADSRSKER